MKPEDIKVIEAYYKNYHLYKREIDLCERAYTKETLNKDKRYQRMVELISTIDRVFKRLEEPFQKFVQVRYWDEYSQLFEWAEVADELGISVSKAYKMRVFIMKETAELLGYLTEPVKI